MISSQFCVKYFDQYCLWLVCVANESISFNSDKNRPQMSAQQTKCEHEMSLFSKTNESACAVRRHSPRAFPSLPLCALFFVVVFSLFSVSFCSVFSYLEYSSSAASSLRAIRAAFISFDFCIDNVPAVHSFPFDEGTSTQFSFCRKLFGREHKKFLFTDEFSLQNKCTRTHRTAHTQAGAVSRFHTNM